MLRSAGYRHMEIDGNSSRSRCSAPSYFTVKPTDSSRARGSVAAMSSDTPPPGLPSRIPGGLSPSSTSTRQGKSSIPSMTTATGAAGRKAKPSGSVSILASLHATPPAVQPLHGSDAQPCDQAGKPGSSFPVPPLNLSSLGRLADEMSTPGKGSSNPASVPRSSSPPMPTASVTPHGAKSKGVSMGMTPSPSHAADKRRLSAGKHASAPRVVFGRALSPRGRGDKPLLQQAASKTPCSGSAAPGGGGAGAADRSSACTRASRCMSVGKSREPVPTPAQLLRATSVDQQPVGAVGRSMSVDKARLGGVGRAMSVERAVRQSFSSTAAGASRPGAASSIGGDSKFRHASPSPALRHLASPADAKGGAATIGAPSSGSAVKGSSLLAAIPEAPRPLSAMKPAAPVTANCNPRPTKPSFNLNLSALKQSQDPVADGSQSGGSSLPSAVPKLNLTPVLQQREEEQGSQAAYKVASAPDKSAGGSKSAAGGDAEAFYYYPKLDPKEERRTMELIQSLPRAPATHMKKVFSAMVEAKQNCEAIAFRGHRLLDQLQSHMKEKLDEKVRKEEELKQQLNDFERINSEQQHKIESLRMVILGLQGLSKSGGMGDVSALLGALGIGGDDGGQQAELSQDMSQGSSGSVGAADMEAASALRDLENLSANMVSIHDTVSQMSSRLGGVAVMPRHGEQQQQGWLVAVAGEQGSGRDSELSCDQGSGAKMPQLFFKASGGGGRGVGMPTEDDRRPEQDIGTC